MPFAPSSFLMEFLYLLFRTLLVESHALHQPMLLDGDD